LAPRDLSFAHVQVMLDALGKTPGLPGIGEIHAIRGWLLR
jgi:hypothetical protein